MLENTGFNSDEHYKSGGFSPNICSWSMCQIPFTLPHKVEILWVMGI